MAKPACEFVSLGPVVPPPPPWADFPHLPWCVPWPELCDPVTSLLRKTADGVVGDDVGPCPIPLPSPPARHGRMRSRPWASVPSSPDARVVLTEPARGQPPSGTSVARLRLDGRPAPDTPNAHLTVAQHRQTCSWWLATDTWSSVSQATTREDGTAPPLSFSVTGAGVSPTGCRG